MKIAINFHTADHFVSGVEYYCLGLLNALLQIDNSNEYIVFTNQPELIRKHVTATRRLAIRDVSFLKTRALRIFWEHFILPRLIKKEKIDLLHCPSYIIPSFGLPVPCVVTIHDTIAIDHPHLCKTSNALYYNLFMKKTVNKASRIITVSQTVASDIYRNFSVNGSKVRVIYPGLDSIFAKRNYDLNKIRNKYNLPNKYILFVGNLEPKKNIAALLDAFRLLRDKNLPHKLVFTGNRNWKSDKLFKKLKNPLNSDKLITTGYVERNDLPAVYQMADLLAFISIHEGFGFPPIEAFASGTPVVATATGILKEETGEACCLVPHNQIIKIAQAIFAILTNPAMRNKLINLGLKYSMYFNWQLAAQQTLDVYKKALS